MSRRSLRPQLNQIRGWVRQGRTDAWIAHQLEVTVQQIQAFKREHELEPDGDERGGGPEEVDLRAEDDARSPPSSRPRRPAARRRRPRPPRRPQRKAAEEEDAEGDEAEDGGEAQRPAPRRGGRRAGARAPGRSRARSTTARRATACGSTPPSQDDPVYAEHWAGHRPVEVTIEEDQIVIRRAGGGDDDDED